MILNEINNPFEERKLSNAQLRSFFSTKETGLKHRRDAFFIRVQEIIRSDPSIVVAEYENTEDPPEYAPRYSDDSVLIRGLDPNPFWVFRFRIQGIKCREKALELVQLTDKLAKVSASIDQCWQEMKKLIEL